MPFSLEKLSFRFFFSITLAPFLALALQNARSEGIVLAKSAAGGGSISQAGAIAPDGTIFFGSRSSSFGSTAALYSFKSGSLTLVATALDDIDVVPTISSGGTIYFGSWDGKFRAVNSDGSSRWSFTAGSFITSSAAIGADGTIYFGSGDKRLYALNSDGSTKWSFATSDWVESSPVICNDGTIVFGSWDGYVYALSASGGQKWKYNSGAPITSSPAAGSTGNIYIATRDGRLVGLRSDGTKLFEINLSSTIESSPVIAPGVVYIATIGGDLVAVGNGNVIWRLSLGAAIYSSPTIREDGSILITSGNQVVCASSSGTINWKVTLDANAEGSPTIGDDGTIYVGAVDGRIFTIAGSSVLSSSAWPQFHRDNRRSGLAMTPILSTAGVFEPDAASADTGNSLDGSTLSNFTTPSNGSISGAAPTPTPPLGSETTSIVVPTPQPATPATSGGGRVVNLSARAFVGTGDNVAIAGFIATGTGTKTLLVRGVGPGLTSFGVVHILTSPQLKLYSGSVQLRQISAWSNDAQVTPISAQIGAFPLAPSSQDAAGVIQIDPAGYTIVTSGANGTTGVVLLEVYDADKSGANSAQLTNISCRAFVGTGEKSLIGGICIGGDGPINVLIRLVGPSLTQYGVKGVLANPAAEIHQTINGQDQILAANDDWNGSPNANAIRTATTQAGISPLPEHSLDSALLLTLNPGGYTVIAKGADGGTGVALIELYRLP